MDELSIPPYSEIDQASKAFFRLLRDAESKLIQCERIVLRIEHPGRKPGFNVPVCVRVPRVNVPAHANTRGLENLIQSRYGAGLRLSEHRGRGCEERRNGGSKKKLFHCWTFQLVERRTRFSTAHARIFLVSDQWAEGLRERRNRIPRTCVG